MFILPFRCQNSNWISWQSVIFRIGGGDSKGTDFTKLRFLARKNLVSVG